ncbi:MAG: Uma2 family endonuclease [Fimbriiglobus sp.]
MSAMPPTRLFTPSEYLEIIHRNILPDADQLELLRGRIVKKMSRNEPHDGSIQALLRRLYKMLPESLGVRCQLGMVLVESVLEPDIAIVTGSESSYFHQHPSASEALMVIDIADTSLAQDLGDKLTVYALAKIPEYWVVDIPHRQNHVFTKPKGGKKPGYKSQVTYSDVDSVPVFDVGELKVSEVLP